MGGRGLDLLGLGLGLEVLGPDWGAGAGAGLEGAGYPDVVGLCSTRNPMGLKHLLGGFGELSREGVRFGGSQRCLICAFNKDGTWPMSGARLQLLTQDFTRSLTGEEVGGGGGGGGRPRHRLSAKIASIDSIIANLKNDKRVQAKSSVVGADSKRKGNARLIVAELDTKLGGSGGGGGRPRNWRSAKVAGASIVIARLRQEKRYHGRVR